MRRQRLADQRLPVGLAGHVNRRGDRFAAGGADIGSNLLGIGGQDVGDDNLGALLCKQPRLGLTHAVRTTGDDRDFALQPHDPLLDPPAGSLPFYRGNRRSSIVGVGLGDRD